MATHDGKKPKEEEGDAGVRSHELWTSLALLKWVAANFER